MTTSKNEISLLITGQAGQGIQTVEKLLSEVLFRAGLNVFATKEYMSRVRGGANSTQIRISADRVDACIDRTDILISLDKDSAGRTAWRLCDETLIVGNFHDDIGGVKEYFDYESVAKNIGSPIFSNVVATGVALAIVGVDKQIIEGYLREIFASKGEDIIEKNKIALQKGYEKGAEIAKKRKRVNITTDNRKRVERLINGTQAVAEGAIAGGCNFISAYPMSPATGVFASLASMSKRANILVEQAEDEISAINMVLGAWYAGAKGLVTTSGGGFALMEEGVSLAGITETPIVIHIGQRPGPATGLPTRTEQADLTLALYSGHGEFPRIIFAPGNIEEAFSMTKKAFILADKFQVPVFILTDQYLLDSYYNLPAFQKEEIDKGGYIVKTNRDYRRYQLTEDGISPRGIPGYGSGFVCVDSDEHDEYGRITEDMSTRENMVEKRWKKMAAIEKEIVPPVFHGDPENYKTLLIGWGSTYNAIKEALKEISEDSIAYIHFSQIFPLDVESINEYLNKAEKVVSIENNFSGQFAALLTQMTGYKIEDKITKYSGLPFSVEEIQKALRGEK